MGQSRLARQCVPPVVKSRRRARETPVSPLVSRTSAFPNRTIARDWRVSAGESRTSPRRGAAPTARNRVSRGEGSAPPVVTQLAADPSAASEGGIPMSAGSIVLNSRNSNPSSVVTELCAFVNQATAISSPTNFFPSRRCIGGSRVLRDRDRLTDEGRQIAGSDCEVFERLTRLASTRASTRFVQRRRRSAPPRSRLCRRGPRYWTFGRPHAAVRSQFRVRIRKPNCNAVVVKRAPR